jgi:DNA-binding transcriptional regulator PaaX
MSTEKVIGKIEEFRYSDSILATTTKFVLLGIAGAGVMLGGAVIPGVLKLISEFERLNSFEQKHSEEKIKNAFYALKRRKFIKIIKFKNGKIRVRITAKGKKRLREFQASAIYIHKPAVWDKKWRVLIFDIPTKLNSARAALRHKIKSLGFYQFQGSVWFYPYSCEDEVLTVAELFGVSEYVEIIVAESILHEKELKKFFKLTKYK